MESGAITDDKISASSKVNAGTPAKNGRLNYVYGSSWCASPSDKNPYLEIDLGVTHIICAVSTEGNSRADEWVKTYTLQFYTGGAWTNYEEDGQVKVSSQLCLFFCFQKIPLNSAIFKTLYHTLFILTAIICNAFVRCSRSSERILIWCSCGTNAEIFLQSRATACKLAAPINFIKGTSAGKLDSFPFDFVSLIFP